MTSDSFDDGSFQQLYSALFEWQNSHLVLSVLQAAAASQRPDTWARFISHCSKNQLLVEQILGVMHICMLAQEDGESKRQYATLLRRIADDAPSLRLLASQYHEDLPAHPLHSVRISYVSFPLAVPVS
jgi:hypothetical protein